MKTIYLIRHGETDFNSQHKLQGKENTLLNAQGLEQAQRLAQRLKDVPLDQIFTSNLTRTKQTAQPLADIKALPLIEVPALQEMSFGIWESVPFEDIKANYPKELDLFFNHPTDFKLPGAETFQAAQKRGWEAVKKIIAQQKDETSIAIISHGGLLRTVFCAMLDMDLNALWKINLYNTAVSCIYEQKPGKYFLKYINNVEKL